MPGLLIHGARQVLTLRGAACPRRGTALRNLSIIEDGSILIEDGKICGVGPTRRIENLTAARNAHQISARGRVVMPGFVDSHMHLISAQGQAIIGEGDASAVLRDISQTPAWRLTADALAQLRRCLRYGTTTIDVKIGSGLDEAADLKLLRILAGLAKEQPVDLVSTYCGSSSVPVENERQADAYLERLASYILPMLKEKDLATFVALPVHLNDAQRKTIADIAASLGLGIKIHADSAVDCADMNATTVEYLENVSEPAMHRLADSAAVAVLMPSCGFHQNDRGYAPARDLIARGVAVALATGYDRAANPSFSMPITIELACRKLGMAPSEAIVAATVNAAYAVGRGESVGSIEPGKRANILVLETADYRDLAYETGINPVDITIIGGEIACRNSVAYGAAALAG